MISDLSIVIPTHGRPHLIDQLLESIAIDAENEDFDVEVILVDDSPPPEAAAIHRIGTERGARILDSPTSNVGGKRNFGVQNATADLILFLDSDVTIRRGTLRAHFDRLSSAPGDIAGCLGKVEFTGEKTHAWEVIESMQLTLPFSYPDISEYVPWGPTANLSIRRGPFLDIGGFDATLNRYGGEDVDIGLRWSYRGMRIMTAPEAVAEHAIQTWSTWRQNFRRLWSFGLADYHLLVRHPSRSFFDLPTGPMLWVAQLALLSLLLAFGAVTLPIAAVAIATSVMMYPLVYAALKRTESSSLRIHLLGPIIFWTMDFAKALEAIRGGRPGLILRRLLFLDDLIAQDWREIAASAWALSASALTFITVVILLKNIF